MPDQPHVRCDPTAPPAPLEVDAAQLRGSAIQGSYFLQTHGLKLPRGVMRIRLEVPHPTQFEVSVDGNDLYRLRFLAGSEVLGERTLPDKACSGLAVQRIDVPAATEVIEVEVSGGDGIGSIGHLVPVP